MELELSDCLTVSSLSLLTCVRRLKLAAEEEDAQCPTQTGAHAAHTTGFNIRLHKQNSIFHGKVYFAWKMFGMTARELRVCFGSKNAGFCFLSLILLRHRK